MISVKKSLTKLRISNRLQSRLLTIFKCVVFSIIILGFIVTALSLLDHATGEVFHLINHTLYSPKSLYWDRVLLVDKVVQIVCLPIPCSLIFIIIELLAEIYDIACTDGKVLKGNDGRIIQLKEQLLRLYDMHDKEVADTNDHIKDMRKIQIENVLGRLDDETKEEYLQHLLNYNEFVLELNKDCDDYDVPTA